MEEMRFDIFGITENNLYWPWVPREWRLRERLERLFPANEIRVTWAYNQNDKPEKVKQWGGTSQVCRGKAMLKFFERGSDPTKLGRWTWQKFRGANGRKLKVISAYRPCDKRNSSGTQNTFHQHRHHLLKLNRNVNPRQAILQDLAEEIKASHTSGETSFS